MVGEDGFGGDLDGFVVEFGEGGEAAEDFGVGGEDFGGGFGFEGEGADAGVEFAEVVV